MNPVYEWLLKEYMLFLKELPRFINYYNFRDRITFYTLFSYILRKNKDNWIPKYASTIFLSLSVSITLISTYYWLLGLPKDILTGFNWNYVAPIQYLIQILFLTYIGLKTTKDITYSVALGYNGAAATGYLYEIPYWIFSIKKAQTHFLHASYRYIFYIDFQIIAIGAYIWLLKEQKINFNKKDLIGFLIVFGISFLLASQMYIIKQQVFARIPMILYFIYLALKLGSPPE